MKFHSEPIEEHDEVPLADDGRWEALVDHWARRHSRPEPRPDGRNACYVVSVVNRGLRSSRASRSKTEAGHDDVTHRNPPLGMESRDAQLAEILALVRAQGDAVVGHRTLERDRPDPRTFLGRGAAQEVAARATELGADLVVIDAELSPSQMRNLEDAAGIAVCDREAVILNVFERHARTRKARIQVEIAHLEYLRPRIRGLGLEMDQQAGGLMKARGPGETASELLARRLDGRLAELRKAFSRLSRAGQVQRKGRSGCKRIALVGYTNAGKTSLMNALTEAGLSARNMPFETLDTTSRCLTRHGGDVVLSDTVGFIRRLPQRLLESFESTLAELCEADLLALVVDASDPEWELHVQTTESLLGRLGAEQIPRLYVFNKLDRLPVAPSPAYLQACSHGHPTVVVSAHEPETVEQLRRALLSAVRAEHRTVRLWVPYTATEVTARIYAQCRVMETEATDDCLVFTLEGPAHVVDQIERALEEVWV